MVTDRERAGQEWREKERETWTDGEGERKEKRRRGDREEKRECYIA